MAHRSSSRVISLLLRRHPHPHHRSASPPTTLHHHFTTSTSAATITKSHPLLPLFQHLHTHTHTHTHTRARRFLPFTIRFLSTRSPRASRPARPDIGARARQLQNRRLWTYALTFSCIAGFIVIVLNQFQDQLVFYVTPTDALSKYNSNPSKSKFRLGGLVLDGSVSQIPSSPEMEFVITDLITDMLVKYEGSLPDLFREGHSAVVEGFVKPYTDEMKQKERGLLGKRNLEVTEKARSRECYFSATEVLAKHDEKYMPKEVADALEKNKKLIEKEEEEKTTAAAAAAAAAAGGSGPPTTAGTA